ncbi:MAG: IPT/TIG domain-containing protein [Terracidiphilus sp.]
MSLRPACAANGLALALPILAVLAPWAARPLHAQDADLRPNPPEVQKALENRFEDGEGKESDFVRNRIKWFHDQRAYPHKTLPAGIRQQAIKDRDRKTTLESAIRASLAYSETTPVEPAWKLIGPEPVSFYGIDSGRVSALAIDPANPRIVYMGGAEGGVWKSTNGGETWTPIGDTQVTLAIGAIAIDPNNSNTVYAATGEENFAIDSYYGAGILKSTNGGETWTQLPGGFTGVPCGGDWIGGIAIQPGDSKVVLAAVESCYYGQAGIYRSADGGQTWAAVYVPTNAWNPGTSIFFDAGNGNIAYAALDPGDSPGPAYPTVIKSTDGGLTWKASSGSGANALPAGSNIGRIALAIAPSDPSILYAALADNVNGDLLGLYKTTDAGANWTQLTGTPDFCSTQCWYDIVLAVSPTNPNFVVAGGVYTYHPGGSAVATSSDGGHTWVDQSAGLHPDTHALAFTPDGSTLYTGNDGGVWRTTDPTANAIPWTDLNYTLAITEFYPGLSMDPGNLNHSYVGTQDNGTERYSGALGWPTVACGDGGPTVIDYVDTSTIYANCIGLSLYKSTDDGSHWNAVTTGFDGTDRTAWVPPLAIDSEHHETLYFGTYRVYRTQNGGSNWKAISGDLTNPNNSNHNGTLSTITVARSDDNTVYTGSDDAEIEVTRNALSTSGATWKAVINGLPDRAVTWIVVDPTTASTAYAGFSGFTGFGDSLGHIFKTTNAGSSWTDISSDLPNTPVDSILVDPDDPEILFIGTDIGTFYTTSDGASWSALGKGLPNVVVSGLGLHENSRTLRATTHGRSVWDLNVAALLPVPTVSTVTPARITADDKPVMLTVTGYQFNSKAVVVWNRSAVPTTYVSNTEVRATVPSSDLTKGGAATVGVLNGSGGKLSNLITLTVDNPAPKLVAISPSTAKHGAAGLTLTVTGSNFVKTSQVTWNGKTLSTVYVSQTKLTAAVPAANLRTSGTGSVTVVNPAPGGGTSAAGKFAIQ